MKPETKSFQLEIGGKTVTIETGKYATKIINKKALFFR